MQNCVDLFKTAQQRATDPTLHQTYVSQALRALAEAKKDNDFIYHERVPEVKQLEAIGKAPLAKVAAIPEHFSSNFKGVRPPETGSCRSEAR